MTSEDSRRLGRKPSPYSQATISSISFSYDIGHCSHTEIKGLHLEASSLTGSTMKAIWWEAVELSPKENDLNVRGLEIWQTNGEWELTFSNDPSTDSACFSAVGVHWTSPLEMGRVLGQRERLRTVSRYDLRTSRWNKCDQNRHAGDAEIKRTLQRQLQLQ